MTTQTLFARGSVTDCGSRNLRRSDGHVPSDARDWRWRFQRNQALGCARRIDPAVAGCVRCIIQPPVCICSARRHAHLLRMCIRTRGRRLPTSFWAMAVASRPICRWMSRTVSYVVVRR